MKIFTFLLLASLISFSTYGQKLSKEERQAILDERKIEGTSSKEKSSQKTEKLTEYTASNGITYKVGDNVKLGRGSDSNGRFVYVNIGGWYTYAAATNNAQYNANQSRLGASSTGLIVTIKKIKKYNQKRYKGVYFTVAGGNITNYIIDIESAISTCEIEECNEKNNVSTIIQEVSVYDEIRKIKGLYDDGILTEDEYLKEKKELLDSN